MKKTFLFCLVIFVFKFSGAQNVGIGTTTPQTSAALDISSNNKGLLIPRMTSALRKAIPSPSVGLLVFDTDKNAMYLFDGQNWNAFAFAMNSKYPATERVLSGLNKADGFGESVAMDGDYAVVGAPKDDINGNTNQGSAYIYYRNQGNWEQQAKLVANNGVTLAEFGRSVAISGDYVIVGAPKDLAGITSKAGSAYIFLRNGTTWTQQQKLYAADGETNDLFGWSVALSGSTAIVGAPSTNEGFPGTQPAGSVYSFKRSGTNWVTEPKFTKYHTTCIDEEFGYSVAFDGNKVLVGAPGGAACGAQTNTGQVFACFYNGTNWITNTRIVASDGVSGDRYGQSVSISNNYAFIGAPSRNLPTLAGAGKFYFYRYSSTTWFERNTPQPISGLNGKLGFAVAVVGDIALVSHINYDGENTDEGAVYLYDVSSGILANLLTRIEAVNPKQYASFGKAVAISGKNIIIGSLGKVTFLNVE